MPAWLQKDTNMTDMDKDACMATDITADTGKADVCMATK
jgi:hypothetical protein